MPPKRETPPTDPPDPMPDYTDDEPILPPAFAAPAVPTLTADDAPAVRAELQALAPQAHEPPGPAVSPLYHLAPDPEELARQRAAVPTEEDEYSEVFRGPFITKTRICVGPRRYIPPGKVIDAGAAPRSTLEPLWRLGAVEPWVPPAPMPPKRPRIR